MKTEYIILKSYLLIQGMDKNVLTVWVLFILNKLLSTSVKLKVINSKLISRAI